MKFLANIFCLALLAFALAAGDASVYAQNCSSTPVTKGYRGFNYGSTVYNMPTSEKPEHKLWWNDGYWWGSLWDPGANKYRIHRLNLSSQCWSSVGPDIDDRSQSLADALWDGQKLYIASHITELSGTGPGRLYRYSYNFSSQTYALDAGYPVQISNKESETLTLTKDSSGQLWATWVEGSKVMVNRSTSNDQTWGTPFQLPVQGASVSSDDISAIVAFGGNKVGILWSNQNDKKMYFATHLDSNADDVWQVKETALSDGSKPVADDHINLKITADNGGNVYAVTKSSTSTSSEPLIYVLKRTSSAAWSAYVVATKADNHTRPILSIDEESRKIYVFMARLSGNPRCIYMKSTNLDNIQFPSGLGEEFIRSESDDMVNNPTSTRQNVNSATGIVILASDENTHYYLHNYMSLGGNLPPNQPPVANASGSPLQGTAPLTVNFSSSGSYDPDGSISSYSWNFGDGSSSTQANPAHTYNAAGDYTAILTVTDNKGATNNAEVNIAVAPAGSGTIPSISSFMPTSGPVGTEVIITGDDLNEVMEVAFNNTPATNFEVDSDNQIRAIVPPGATTGKISVTDAAGTGVSANNFTVTAGAGGTTTTFNPIHDAQVNSSNPTSSYGALATFRVRSGSPNYLSYLKFNVTGLTGAVIRATLRLYVSDDGPDGGAVYSVSNNYLGTATAWLESGLNWNNAPAISGTPVAAVGTAPLNAWVEVDVTSAIPGNGTYSFGLSSSSTNSVYYHSKEGANKPQLVIESSSGTANQPPVAAAAATPTSGNAPLTVTFSSSGSHDPDGTISSYSWSFGDGGSSTQANPVYTYNNSGNYTATLTVTDDQNATASSSVNINASTAPTLPPEPNNLTATAVSASQINLAWNDNSSNESGFKIERKTGASGAYSEIVTLGANATSYNNTGLSANTVYYYRVRAYNAAGNSSFSNEASATTQSSGSSSNLALNKPVTASGYYDAAHSPEKAVDGNLSKYWRSQTLSSSNQIAWLQVDLQSQQTVARAVVRWKDNYFARTYQLQISNDAANWTTVYTNSAGAAGVQDFSFAAAGARYVRLYCSLKNMNSYRVIELELYASGLGKGGGEDDFVAERIPREITLQQNYPNPFNPSTKISYGLPQAAQVTLRVYDVIGNVVATLAHGPRPAGMHTVSFNAGHLSAGMYYYVLQAGEVRIVRRLSYVK